MRLATMLFCEYAATTREGKLDAGGILQLVWAEAFPLEVENLVLVATLELERGEYGHHTLELIVEESATAEQERVLEQTFDAAGRFHRVGVNLGGLSLRAPGLYQFRLFVDGKEIGDATLVAHDEEPQYPV